MAFKICHITTVHPAFDVRIFYRECVTLSQAGYDITLIAQHDKDEVVDGVKIIALPKVKGRLIRFFKLDAIAFWKALKHKAEVYHFHDPELIPWMIILKLITKAKVVYDMHEYYSEVIVDRSERLRKLSFLKYLLKILLEKFPAIFYDLVVFPTFALEREFAFSRKKGLTLINLPSVQDIKKVTEIDTLWNEKEYDIIHVGTISPPRMKFMLNVAQCLEEDFKDFKWLFLGVSKATIYWAFENYDRSFLDSHFIFLEIVPYNQVLSYLKKSKIGFNYHPFEKRFLVSLPVKVFEYMLMGLPVVTTELPELRTLLDEKCVVFVNSQRPRDYAIAIKELLSKQEESLRLGECGRELIINKLNWEFSEKNKLLDAYKNLVNKEAYEK